MTRHWLPFTFLLILVNLLIPVFYLMLLIQLRAGHLLIEERLYIVNHYLFLWVVQLVMALLTMFVCRHNWARVLIALIFIVFFVFGMNSADDFAPF
jgi:hypothetical protein